MRTLLEIIEAVKDGEEASYEEILYALLVMDSLRYFDHRALREAYKRAEGHLAERLHREFNESFNRTKRALSVSPKTWIGEGHDPKNLEYTRFRKGAFKLLEKVTRDIFDKQAAGNRFSLKEMGVESFHCFVETLRNEVWCQTASGVPNFLTVSPELVPLVVRQEWFEFDEDYRPPIFGTFPGLSIRTTRTFPAWHGCVQLAPKGDNVGLHVRTELHFVVEP